MRHRKLTPKVTAAISRLGDDIRTARKKRRTRQKDLAAAMGVSLNTVRRLETGDPGISTGVLAMAFLALGGLHRLAEAFDVASDDVGLVRDRFELPRRIRRKKVVGKEPGEPVGDGFDPEGLAL